MLLDRKKINSIARWTAIILAVTFALGTVFLGVGSSTGNIFSGCSKSSPTISSTSSFEEREKFYLDILAETPQDSSTLLQLANLYADDSVARYDDAIVYLNKYLEIDPKSTDVRLRLASIYLTKLNDAPTAVKTLTEVTKIDPQNTMAFLQLGLAAKTAGQNQVAILAWNRYLELAPNSEYAATVKDEIAKLTALPPTTTGASTVPSTTGASTPVPAP